MKLPGHDLLPLDGSFFDRGPEEVAYALLGCHLITLREGRVTGGVIVETEAYLGANDAGSHAATKGVTSRNRVMYDAPGTVYVYFTYGVHHMFNLVCCPAGEAGAVLVRAIEPREGVDTMQSRRRGIQIPGLCNGPGKLAQALAIDLSDNGGTLGSRGLWVCEGERVSPNEVVTSGRIGLSAGHELELRYYLKDSQYVSRGRTGPRALVGRRKEEASE